MAQDLRNVLGEHTDLVLTRPAAAMNLPIIQAFLETHKQDEQQLVSIMEWTGREGTNFNRDLQCDLTLTADPILELTRLARLVIDGKVFGTVRFCYHV